MPAYTTDLPQPPLDGTAGGTRPRGASAPSLRRARRSAWAEHLVLALVAWVPQLLTRPGVATADTKSYLYVDPGRYLRQSLSMWDPTVGLGTVTHQQIGYLFPMGPFFWATHALGLPTWAAQRLWVGALLFAAGTGVLALCRTVGVGAPGRVVAALAYMSSPYVLQYLGHISVILLAFAALPWLVALVERAVGGGGGWRYPALVALVVAAMGSVNASSAFYVALGPVVWVLYAGMSGLHRWRAVGAAIWRVGVLGVLVSLWWVVGLAIEGGYGLDVLRYTETVQAVSTTSSSSEVLRGLGYWYFYGGDNFGPWISATPQFTQEVWLLGVGYATALVAVVGAFVVRWRQRAAWVAMAGVGMVLAVGAYPYASPTPVGRLLRALFTDTTAGMALRSTDRATPLVVLGLAMLAGAGVSALGTRARRAALVAAGLVGAVVLVADPALWDGASIPDSFVEAAPAAYQQQAAGALDATGKGSAVLGVPGQPFAATFAGMSVDPLWPALLSRPFVTREQQVMGSLATEDLLYALDDPIQSGVADPRALAPVARLMGVGDLLVQNDLAFTRYDQPDPAVLWSQLAPVAPAGLSPPVGYGPVRKSLSRGSVIDQQTYTLAPTTPPMPSVATMAVSRPRAPVRLEPATAPLVVDGEGTGLVDLAGTGLLRGDPTVLYAGTLDTHRAARAASLRAGATLVVTDTNRRQAFRWDNLQDVAGPTLASGQPQPAVAQNAPLDLFPGAPPDAQTTTALTGVSSVSASGSGNPFQYLPEDRPAEAVDGDPDTAWQVGPFLDPVGQWWQVVLAAPERADAVSLLQPQVGDHNQWITAVTLSFDGGSPLRVRLGAGSRRGAGQVVRFPTRTFRTLRVSIDATNLAPSRSMGGGISAVGLAEVGIGAVRAEEQLVMPSDLLRAAGAGSEADRLAIVMTRLRVAPATSRTDPEASLDRSFWLPSARDFTVTGTVRIDPLVPDTTVDRLLGRRGPVSASSTGRLAGDPAATASAALDGDPATAWTSPLGDHHQVGQALTVTLATPVTFDHLDLQVVVDGRHSVPSELRVATGHSSAVVTLPKLARQQIAGGVDRVTVHFAPMSGSRVTLSVLAVRPLRWVDYFTGSKTALPVAIAELGIPGVQVGAPTSTLSGGCRGDLVQVDGAPLWVEATGTSAAALDGSGAGLRLCGPDSGGLELGPGTHHLSAVPGARSGLDVDQLVLDSAPGGTASSGDQTGSVAEAATGGDDGLALRVTSHSATSMTVRISLPVTGALAEPQAQWLVLGQSLNRGWSASVDGGATLGAPELVDGFANGWLLAPDVLRSAARSGDRRVLTLELRWKPQQAQDLALVVSAAAGASCLALVLWPRRRRRGPRASGPASGGSAPARAPSWDPPELAWPLGRRVQTEPRPGGRAEPRSQRWRALRRTATATAAAGLAAGTAVAPLAGVVVALATLGACSTRRGRSVLAASAVALVVATAVTMMSVEAAGHFYGNGSWPSHFGLANSFTWLAMSLLVADTFVTGLGPREDEGVRLEGPREASPSRGGSGVGAQPGEPPGSAAPWKTS